jgi:hypothetical protein
VEPRKEEEEEEDVVTCILFRFIYQREAHFACSAFLFV